MPDSDDAIQTGGVEGSAEAAQASPSHYSTTSNHVTSPLVVRKGIELRLAQKLEIQSHIIADTASKAIYTEAIKRFRSSTFFDGLLDVFRNPPRNDTSPDISCLILCLAIVSQNFSLVEKIKAAEGLAHALSNAVLLDDSSRWSSSAGNYYDDAVSGGSQESHQRLPAILEECSSRKRCLRLIRDVSLVPLLIKLCATHKNAQTPWRSSYLRGTLHDKDIRAGNPIVVKRYLKMCAVILEQLTLLDGSMGSQFFFSSQKSCHKLMKKLTAMTGILEDSMSNASSCNFDFESFEQVLPRHAQPPPPPVLWRQEPVLAAADHLVTRTSSGPSREEVNTSPGDFLRSCKADLDVFTAILDQVVAQSSGEIDKELLSPIVERNKKNQIEMRDLMSTDRFKRNNRLETACARFLDDVSQALDRYASWMISNHLNSVATKSSTTSSSSTGNNRERRGNRADNDASPPSRPGNSSSLSTSDFRWTSENDNNNNTNNDGQVVVNNEPRGSAANVITSGLELWSAKSNNGQFMASPPFATNSPVMQSYGPAKTPPTGSSIHRTGMSPKADVPTELRKNSTERERVELAKRLELEAKILELEQELFGSKKKVSTLESKLEESERDLMNARTFWLKESERASRLYEEREEREAKIGDLTHQLAVVTQELEENKMALAQLKALTSSSPTSKNPSPLIPANTDGPSNGGILWIQRILRGRNSPLQGSKILIHEEKCFMRVFCTFSLIAGSPLKGSVRIQICNDSGSIWDMVSVAHTVTKYVGDEPVKGQNGKEGSGLAVLGSTPVPYYADSGSKATLSVVVECTAVFEGHLMSKFSFVQTDGTPRLVTLRLPVFTLNFMEGVKLSNVDFYAVWKSSELSNTEVVRKFFVDATLLNPKSDLVRALELGGAFCLLPGADADLTVLILAGVLKTMDTIACVRVAVPDTSRSSCTVFVRSSDPKLAKLVARMVVAVCGEP